MHNQRVQKRTITAEHDESNDRCTTQSTQSLNRRPSSVRCHRSARLGSAALPLRFSFRLTGVEQVECLLNFLLLLLGELCSLRSAARRRRLGAGRLLKGRHLCEGKRRGGGCCGLLLRLFATAAVGCGSRGRFVSAQSDEWARVASLACGCGGCRWFVVGSETANGEQKEKKEKQTDRAVWRFQIGQFAQMNKNINMWNLIMRRHILHLIVQPIRRCVMQSVKMTGFQFLLKIN